MKRKVLYVITKSNWGGAQRYVFNLATALPRDDFDVAVAVGGTGLAGSTEGELAHKLRSANIPVCLVPSFARDVSIFSDLRAFFELVSLFKKELPDVVHLNSSKAGGVGALAARFAGWQSGHPIKILFTSHGLAWEEDRNSIAKKLIYLFSRATFALCHKVIVISLDNFKRTQTFSSPGKYVLIHNGLAPLLFEDKARARVSLGVRTGLTEVSSEFWIGTIAELTRNKGLTYLLDAAKILADSGKKFHLFIIGGGEEEQSLKKQIADHHLGNSVHLSGFMSDAYRYNKAFDLFVLTSVKEGLPTVLLEAGQAGVAVVASDIPGTRDIIEDNVTGKLFESKNPTALADSLATLMDDPSARENLARGLQEKMVRKFSIEQMVDKTTKLYSKE